MLAQTSEVGLPASTHLTRLHILPTSNSPTFKSEAYHIATKSRSVAAGWRGVHCRKGRGDDWHQMLPRFGLFCMTQDRLAVHLVSGICSKMAAKVLVGKACLRIPGLAGLQDLKNEQEGLHYYVHGIVHPAFWPTIPATLSAISQSLKGIRHRLGRL